MKSSELKPKAVFSETGNAANDSVNRSFAANSGVTASRSTNWLPSSCAGGSKLGSVGRVNGFGVGGGSAAHCAASARDSSPHTVHDDVSGDDVMSQQQRQQQCTGSSGG